MGDIKKDYDTEAFKEYIRTNAKLRLSPELAQKAGTFILFLLIRGIVLIFPTDSIDPLILPLFPKLFASMHLSSDFELVNTLSDLDLSITEVHFSLLSFSLLLF